jgi:hypothetical protein
MEEHPEFCFAEVLEYESSLKLRFLAHSLHESESRLGS